MTGFLPASGFPFRFSVPRRLHVFTVGLCGLNIEIDNRYGYVESLCRNYIGTDGGAAAFRVRVSGRTSAATGRNATAG